MTASKDNGKLAGRLPTLLEVGVLCFSGNSMS